MMWKRYKHYYTCNKKFAKNTFRSEKRADRVKQKIEEAGIYKVKITKTMLRQYRETYDYLKAHEDNFAGDNLRRADYILADLCWRFNDYIEPKYFEEFFTDWHTKRKY